MLKSRRSKPSHNNIFSNINMSDKQVGVVTHWYDKIGVAVVKLSDSLKVGDRIKISRGNEEFEAVVESMQVDHENVESAKSGDEAAIKLSQKAKEGAIVYALD